MRELSDASRIIEQGQPDRYAQWFADQLDPIRHLERYRRAPAITFESGADHHHVPSENARAFVRALGKTDPGAADQIRVQTYPGLDHLGVTSGEAPLTAAVDWLTNSEPAPRG